MFEYEILKFIHKALVFKRKKRQQVESIGFSTDISTSYTNLDHIVYKVVRLSHG